MCIAQCPTALRTTLRNTLPRPALPRSTLTRAASLRRSTTHSLFILALAASCLQGAFAQGNAAAQTPAALGSEAFKIVAPFPPGGPIDTLARLLAPGLAER